MIQMSRSHKVLSKHLICKCCFILILGLFVLGCQSEIETSHPNIIIILADDLGSGDLSSYNETSQIHTPKIDKLAREGMKFTQAHSPSSAISTRLVVDCQELRTRIVSHA